MDITQLELKTMKPYKKNLNIIESLKSKNLQVTISFWETIQKIQIP
jgi:hypothetical protein